MTQDVPQTGDTLVIAKAGGRADVRKLKSGGAWDFVRDGANDVHSGWEIARSNLELEPKGRKVWYRAEAESDSAIRPY
jgi:hypothetical protein